MSTEPENRPDAFSPEQGAPGAFSPRPPAGTVAWAMGFLAFIPIPIPILGTIRASRAVVFSAPVAVPFLR